MLVIFGAVIAAATAVMLSRVRAPRATHAAKLGWMSEQWLAEHRASHPS